MNKNRHIHFFTFALIVFPTMPAFSGFFKIRRAFLTMLEMLIVMALIAITASLVGIKAVEMIRKQKFRTGVDLVVEKLGMAQSLMLVFKTDVTLTLTPLSKGKGTECLIRVENPIPSQIKKIINLYSTIEGVKSFSFDGENGEWKGSQLHLHFSSLSQKLPQGSLVLKSAAPSKNSHLLEQSIYLSGLLQPITLDAPHRKEKNSPYVSEALFPTELREQWKLAQIESQNLIHENNSKE